jgi:hypothetical protein
LAILIIPSLIGKQYENRHGSRQFQPRGVAIPPACGIS